MKELNNLVKESRKHFIVGEVEKETYEWEHAMYIMKGIGKVVIQGEEGIVREGMLAFVPRDAVHSVLNIGKDELVVWGVSGPPKTEAGYTQLKKRWIFKAGKRPLREMERTQDEKDAPHRGHS